MPCTIWPQFTYLGPIPPPTRKSCVFQSYHFLSSSYIFLTHICPFKNALHLLLFVVNTIIFFKNPSKSHILYEVFSVCHRWFFNLSHIFPYNHPSKGAITLQDNYLFICLAPPLKLLLNMGCILSIFVLLTSTTNRQGIAGSLVLSSIPYTSVD